MGRVHGHVTDEGELGHRSELLGWVLHDLRAPLTRIRAIVEGVEDGVFDDRDSVRRNARVIARETERLSAMLDGLFDLARTATARWQLPRIHVPLAEVVEQALTSSEPLARQRFITLRLVVREPVVVEGAVLEIGRAITNLLDNALRASPRGTDITAETGRRGRWAYAAITDECGMVEEELRVLLSPSHTVEAGLGLPIVQAIAASYGGEVHAEVSGAGCRFTLLLPLAGSDPASRGGL